MNRRTFLETLVAGLIFAGTSNLVGEDKFCLSYLKVYDKIVNREVKSFNLKHKLELDPDLIKAMIVTESGSLKHRNTAFKHDPMQIANQGDYALEVLANNKEYTSLIGDFSILKDKRKTPWNRYKNSWDYSNSNMNAKASIHGGIGWLIHKAAVYGIRISEGGKLIEYKVTKRDWDGFSGIAKRNGSTIHTIKKYNPKINSRKLRIGQKLYFRRAKQEIYIRGWRDWKEAVWRYNGGGDPNYVGKVYRNLRKIKIYEDNLRKKSLR